MKYSEGSIGRIFVIRLEDGDRLPHLLEEFAKQKGVSRAMCILIGGIDQGGTIVVGPRERDSAPPEPVLLELGGVHEVAGVGTLFPDADGKPRLHMHAALGRGDKTHTGCIRPGISVWNLGEVIMLEILGSPAVRRRDAASGFDVLEAEG